MTLPLFIKLLLILLFIPTAYGLTWGARRYLPVGNPLRAALERHGVEKSSRFLLFAVYAVGGVILTLVYS
jgi:hypothetical protein